MEATGTKYHLRKINDQIMEGTLSGTLSISDAREMVEARKRLTAGKETHVIIFVNDISKINMETMRYLSKEGGELVKSTAIVIGNSMIANYAVNLFLSLAPQNKPIKIFKTRARALEWLENQP